MCYEIAAELYGWGISVVAVNGGYLFVGGGVDYATFDRTPMANVHPTIATLIVQYLQSINFRNGIVC